jgi:hypothetical protein
MLCGSTLLLVTGGLLPPYSAGFSYLLLRTRTWLRCAILLPQLRPPARSEDRLYRQTMLQSLSWARSCHLRTIPGLKDPTPPLVLFLTLRRCARCARTKRLLACIQLQAVL